MLENVVASVGRDLPPNIGFRLQPLPLCRVLGVSPVVHEYGEANDEHCGPPGVESELLTVVVHLRVTHMGPVTCFALLVAGVTHVSPWLAH
jgi:hypothetical protein